MLVNVALSPTVSREAVTLDEFTAHSRITSADENDDISQKLTAARVWVENELGRALITSKWQYSFAAWPCREYIELPLGNLQSVQSVVYTDSDGVDHTWAASNYKLSRVYSSGEDDLKLGRLYYKYGGSWPSEVLDVGEPITITFTAGWASASDVPAPIKTAIMLLAAHWYEHREAVVIGENVTIESKAMELALEACLAPYRIVRV